MSKTAAERLLKEAGDGTGLRRELDAALAERDETKRREAFLATASRHGYEFTAGEFEEAVAGAQAAPAVEELSDADLDSVTGGVAGLPASNVDFGYQAVGSIREPRPVGPKTGNIDLKKP